MSGVDFKPGDLVRLSGSDWWRQGLGGDVVEVIGRDDLGPRVVRKHNDGIHYRIFVDKDRDYSAELVEAAPLAPVKSDKSYYGGDFVQRFIESFSLNWNRASVVKYVARAGKKNPDTEIEDIEKALWYLNRELETLKEAK